MPLSATHQSSQKLASLGSTAQHAKTMLRPYLRCPLGSGRVEDALSNAIESLEVLQRELADAIRDEQMATEIRLDITNGLSHDGICLRDLDRLDELDRELQAEKDAVDLLVMGNIEGTPKGKDEPAAPLYWKFTPDVDEAPHPWACGGGENPLTRAIGESNFKNASVERRPA